MIITSNDVKKIADLAKLELSDAEIEKFLPQLQQILDNATMLEEVDTEGVEPIAQITGIDNMVYVDEVQDSHLGEKLLAQSPQPIERNMIKVSNIL